MLPLFYNQVFKIHWALGMDSILIEFDFKKKKKKNRYGNLTNNLLLNLELA